MTANPPTFADLSGGQHRNGRAAGSRWVSCSIRMRPDEHAGFIKWAEDEDRSLSNLLEHLLLESLRIRQAEL